MLLTCSINKKNGPVPEAGPNQAPIIKKDILANSDKLPTTSRDLITTIRSGIIL